MTDQATEIAATPENTGPGAMLWDGEKLFEVRGERRRGLKVGERTLTILERQVLDVSKPTDWRDEKGVLRDARGVWRPMVELRAMSVVREAASPAAAEPFDEGGDG